MPPSGCGPGILVYLNFFTCKIRLMITVVPALGAFHMDSVTECITRMLGKNLEDLSQWEQVERAAAERTQVWLHLLSFF